MHKVCNLHWRSGGFIFLHISKHWEDFGHLWFEGTGDEKTINTNHPWSFGGELRGKLVYRAWHLVKSSINVSLFPYSPLTSCGSEIRIMLLRGRRGSEEERAARLEGKIAVRTTSAFYSPDSGPRPPSRCNVSPFRINRKDDSRNLGNKIRKHKNGSYFTLMRETRACFLHTEKPGLL